MATLSENIITDQFTGLPVNMDHLTRCAHKNGQGTNPAVYIVYSCGFLYKKELLELFGVTDKLKDLWERRGIEFNVCLHITDGKIVSCGIDKYTESGGARPSMTTPKCTQQELRIALRILEFVTL
jgi:hypothetical protein